MAFQLKQGGSFADFTPKVKLSGSFVTPSAFHVKLSGSFTEFWTSFTLPADIDTYDAVVSPTTVSTEGTVTFTLPDLEENDGWAVQYWLSTENDFDKAWTVGDLKVEEDAANDWAVDYKTDVVEDQWYVWGQMIDPDGGTHVNDSASFTVGSAPTISSASIDSAGTTLTVNFNESVSRGTGYSDGDWTVNATDGNPTVTYSSGDGTSSFAFTLSRTILDTETVTLDWAGRGDGIEDGSGNDLAATSGQSVTNNSTQEAYDNTETSSHITRVEGDGGWVEDDTFLDSIWTELGSLGRKANVQYLAGGEIGVNISGEDTSYDGANTNAVSKIYDSSDNEIDFTQSTTSAKPTLDRDSGFNSKLVLDFDGSDDELVSSAYDSGETMTRIWVTEHAIDNGFEIYALRGDGTRYIWERCNNDRLRIDIQTSAATSQRSAGSTSFTDGTVYTRGLRIDNGDLRIMSGGSEARNTTYTEGTGISMTSTTTEIRPQDVQRVALVIELDVFLGASEYSSLRNTIASHYGL